MSKVLRLAACGIRKGYFFIPEKYCAILALNFQLILRRGTGFIPNPVNLIFHIKVTDCKLPSTAFDPTMHSPADMNGTNFIKTMNAIVLDNFGGPENFREAKVAMPPLRDHEVLVAIKATAFNPIDYQMRRGDQESMLLASNILGRELAGTVVSTGCSANLYQVGDNVAGYIGSLASNGSYAQYAAVPQQLLAKIPHQLSFAEAAAMPMAGMTALQAYRRLELSGDESIYISGGSGAVGLMLIKMILSGGHKGKIVATAGAGATRDILLRLGMGASNVVDYKKQGYEKVVAGLAANAGYDCCIDLVGGESSDLTAGMLKVHGKYVNITNLETPTTRNQLFDRAANVINVANYAYSLDPAQGTTGIYGEMLAEIFDMVVTKTITPPEVWWLGPLSVPTVRLAHNLLENNATLGKKLIMGTV